MKNKQKDSKIYLWLLIAIAAFTLLNNITTIVQKPIVQRVEANETTISEVKEDLKIIKADIKTIIWEVKK